MKYFKAIFFFFLSSCVLDNLKTFCYIRNNSNKNITIRFSNSEILDSIEFYNENWNTKINSHSTFKVYKDSDKFFSKNNKILYVFYLDSDTISTLINKENTKEIIKRSLLQTISIDVNSIKMSDTLKFNLATK